MLVMQASINQLRAITMTALRLGRKIRFKKYLIQQILKTLLLSLQHQTKMKSSKLLNIKDKTLKITCTSLLLKIDRESVRKKSIIWKLLQVICLFPVKKVKKRRKRSKKMYLSKIRQNKKGKSFNQHSGNSKRVRSNLW